MRGTITKYTPKRGKPTFGYYFAVGRDANGKRIQIMKRGFRTKEEATKALNVAIAEASSEPRKEVPARTFGQMFEEWIRDYVKRECAPKTAEAYQEHGNYAVRRIGNCNLEQITRNLLEDTIRDIADSGGIPTKEHPKGRPLARKTVRHIGFVMRGCFNYAVHRDYLASHPMNGMKLPKLEKSRKPKVVEKEEFQKVLERAAGTRLFPLVVLAEATGCRRGELLALTWSDIDFDSGMMNVEKSLEQTREGGLRIKSTKSGEPRDLAVPAYALGVLEDWKALQERDRQLYGADYAGHNLIFCRPDGEYYVPKQVTARARELMRKVGLRRSLHSLRHSHASGMLSKGVPVATVAERLGHANSSITLGIYTHALKGDKHAAAEVWNQEMGSVVERAARRPAAGNLSKSIKKAGANLQLVEKKRA